MRADTQDASSWDRNPPYFTSDLVSYRSVIRWNTSYALCITFRLFTFNLTGYQSNIYIYIYIYIYGAFNKFTDFFYTGFLESLMPLKNWCSIHARWSKSCLKHSIRFCGIFPSLKQSFIAYPSSKVSSLPDYIFLIHQLWQSGFSRVYSNSCCSCSFEAEIIKIVRSSHKMYSNNILNFQESTTILNACTKKKVWKLI